MKIFVHPSRWGVRARSALAAALVVTCALGLAAGALLLALQGSLLAAADAAAASRSSEIGAQLHTVVPAALAPELLVTDRCDGEIQVLDAGGTVVAASVRAPAVAMSSARPAAGQLTVRDEYGDQPAPAHLRVTAQGVTGVQGPLTVLVAAGEDPDDHTLATTAMLLALGLPAIVLVVGAATYALVGRSLRPVERMRAQVAAITSSDLSERVPEPAPQDEITELARTMNAMLCRLQAGQRAQRSFIGDASHELRNPLSTITAALELARDHPETLDREVLSGVLLPEAERMRQLISDLLLLASADERGLPLQVGDVDLDDVLEAEVSRMRHGGLQVVAEVHPARVRGDAASLARVVRNLGDNALRHAASRVWLGCTVDEDHAVLVVGDDGPGIPSDDRQRVLQRFVRLDDGRARYAGGSGLGLAIVMEIVTAHGGTVAVRASAVGGAELEVRLPRG